MVVANACNCSISFLQSIIESKDIIVDIVLSRSSPHQLKEFTKMQRIVTTNLDAASHKNENGIGVFGGLHVG